MDFFNFWDTNKFLRKSTGTNRTPKMRSWRLSWTREPRQQPSYRLLMFFLFLSMSWSFCCYSEVNFVYFYYSRNIPVITAVLMAWSVDDQLHRVHQAENHGILTLITTANASDLLRRPRSLGPGIWTNSERESEFIEIWVVLGIVSVGFLNGDLNCPLHQ